MRMVSIFDEGAFAPCPHPFNMAAHVLAAGAALGEKTALEILHPDRSEAWSYAELRAAILGTATGLLAIAEPGDAVLMRLGNTVDFPIAYLAALAVGLVPVPTSAALTEREVAKILATLPVARILRDPSVACPDDPRILPLSELQQMRSLPPAPFDMGDPERRGYIIYTSGTSGTPRAVAHAHRAIWARQMMFNGWYGLRASDRLCHAGAFNWTYTLGTGLMDPWTVGATALIPAPGTPARELPGLLLDHAATIFAAAPGVYRQMLKDQTPLDLPHLRHGLSAGEKLPQATRAAWEAATQTLVHEAYGMSECSTFISASPTHPVTGAASGRPQAGRRVAIVDATGTPQPFGTPGIIAVDKGDPGLMREYVGAPEATQERFAGSWFLTGDEAVMDETHQITYLGRADDMMNAGGFRVSPIEVEQAMLTCPGLTGVAATDVLIKEDVRIIAAFYTSAAPLDDTVLRSHAEMHLADYKQPRLFVHRSTLPMGANGKMLRRQLRDEFDPKAAITP